MTIFEDRKDWVHYSKRFLELCNEVVCDLRLDNTVMVSTRNLEFNKSSVKDLAQLTF
jgi:hypothetical protein